MKKSLYTYYKERLIEIGGGSRCIYLRSIMKKSAYDIGRIFEGRENKVSEFIDFLWGRYKHPFPVICNKERKEILENIDLKSRISSAQARNPHSVENNERVARASRRDELNKIIEKEVSKIKELRREAEEIERETGRYELFIGYPFVFGTIYSGGKPIQVKAPLLLFPVKVDTPDENTAELILNEKEKIRINPALIFTYAQSKKLNIDQLELDFDDLSSFRSVSDVIDYLRKARIRIDSVPSRNIYDYSHFKEPDDKGELSVRYAAVLARFPLSNSIYNDYTELERNKLTNDALVELLRPEKAVKIQKRRKSLKKGRTASTPNISYTVKPLDYSQSEVIRRVSECGNMVVYGPPGTGKSQTIVNIITDALAKGKRVLVVSQKKAALDVVFNRLGPINERCMYISDEGKEKRAFYERTLAAHLNCMGTHTVKEEELKIKHHELLLKLEAEEKKLLDIYSTLCDKRPFGLSLCEMYSSSNMIAKNSNEYLVYQRLIENEIIMSLDYKALSDAIFTIKNKELERTYYDFVTAKNKNPLIALTLPGVDIHTISEIRGKLEQTQKTKKPTFDTDKHPYYKLLLSHYKDLSNEKILDSISKLECKKLYPKKLFHSKERRELKAKLTETLLAIDSFAEEYSYLHFILNDEGFISVIDNLLRGNTAYIKLVYDALDSYIRTRDVASLLAGFTKCELELLSFAYENAKNYSSYTEIINRIIPIRIYHEVIYFEELCKEELAKTIDYENIKSRILRLREECEGVCAELTMLKGVHEYAEFYGSQPNNKDFLYQISKKSKFSPIRRVVEDYEEYLLSLFPCWLLSPENVSSLLPLRKNMFDIVIFDEASQVFIESTIPSIFRGKNIVVAGDEKQLRPSSTFMKRYLGSDPDEDEAPSVQAALEVESLLDLAVARYDSANLTYHYRSKFSELIDFSNSAFYSGSLQIAPNTQPSSAVRPIERIKVDGHWVDRCNATEADRIVELLKEIFATRKNGESIGIITFNSDQQSCIADKIEKEAGKNEEFRALITAEKQRHENGEDISIFIKNLENVQGDERDIIIFSIGYAPNAEGKVHSNFGSLSIDGGENRLNVAITRAKSKIYVVTSIEPEDLNVDTAKNAGPRLLKKYLSYARAVSSSNKDEISSILSELKPEGNNPTSIYPVRNIEEQIKERLEKLGYLVDTRIGNLNNRISLAICDKESGKYILGIILDRDAFAVTDATLERDVYKPRFLESRGWKIMRVWCRDFWLSPTRVIKSIVSAIENK